MPAENRRRVVVTAAATTVANESREDAAARIPELAEAWDPRLEQLGQALVQLGSDDPEVQGIPALGVYYDDPIADLPSAFGDQVPVMLVTVPRRVALHLGERLLEGQPKMPRRSHLVHATNDQDISVPDVVALLGLDFPEQWREVAIDPLAWLLQGLPVRGASASKVFEASAGGNVAVAELAERIATGGCDAGLAIASSGYTLPIPFERAQIGNGDARVEPPFTQDASGHFSMEGGAGLLLRSAEDAEKAGAPVLAELLAWRCGAMGSPVINRTVVAKAAAEALAAAGIGTDEPVLVDLYGRGNRIDDGAELSVVELLQDTYPQARSGYLKKGLHYVIGAHGLLGLARLVEARQAGRDQDALAQHDEPGSIAQDRTVPHLTVDPAGYRVVLTLAYSVTGSYTVLVTRLEASA